MAELTFPDIEPVLPEAASGGSSYTEDIQDSTITTTTDANYKHTRPRTTRMIGKWSCAWNSLSDEEYKTIMDFFRQVGKFQSFNWKNWIDGKTYTVRISDKSTWQQYSNGWQGTITFEEV